MEQTPETTVFHYVRGKALLFGALPLALGGAMLWLGVEALDPAWTTQVARGQALVDAPFWIRGPVMLAVGALVFAMGLWMLISTGFGIAVVTGDHHRIAARTIFGRLRQLHWNEIASAKRKKNQLVLSPLGTDTLSQEIWDRKSVLLDVGMLAAAPGEVETLVARHRPDLAFQDVK